MVSNILASRYVHGIKAEVEQRGKILNYFQDLLDEWGLCQKSWMYLEPIFNSGDMIKDLMKETKMFMKEIHIPFTKMVKEANEFDQHRLKKKIKDCDNKMMADLKRFNLDLDTLQKSIISYLENKRKSFPRFYFVSNDDLIEILAHAKDFDHIQQHLNKIFEAIKELEMDRSELIANMKSHEGEIVSFTRKEGAADNINDTLKKVEANMISTVKAIIKTGLQKIQQDPETRNKWIFQHAGQVVLICDSIIWSENTGACLNCDDPIEAMFDWFDGIKIQLDEVIDIVRSDIEPLQRK